MSAQFFNGNKIASEALISSDPRINTGLFPQEDRTEFSQEALEVLKAFEIISFESSQKRTLYETWQIEGIQLIQTTTGIQTLSGYINKLEKTCISLNKLLTQERVKYDTVSMFAYFNYRIKLFISKLKRGTK